MAADLGGTWTVLETEAADAASDVIRSVDSGTTVGAGAVELGVDAAGHRHLLIPLLTGEALAEDRNGTGVQLWRMTIDGRAVASVVCLVPALNDVFERLALEIIREAAVAPSPARRAAEVLGNWRALLTGLASRGVLSDERLVGLLGELLCLEAIAAHDPARRVDTWAGPSSHKHDLIYGDTAIEVKASLVREGRIVSISSIDQLDAGSAAHLYLVWFRLEPALHGGGETLPGVIERLLALGLNGTLLHQSLAQLGYSTAHDALYRDRPFTVLDTRIYEATADGFPRIVRTSFTHGDVPPGTLRLSYSIDLTNEPPAPLAAPEVESLWKRIASLT